MSKSVSGVVSYLEARDPGRQIVDTGGQRPSGVRLCSGKEHLDSIRGAPARATAARRRNLVRLHAREVELAWLSRSSRGLRHRTLASTFRWVLVVATPVTRLPLPKGSHCRRRNGRGRGTSSLTGPTTLPAVDGSRRGCPTSVRSATFTDVGVPLVSSQAIR